MNFDQLLLNERRSYHARFTAKGHHKWLMWQLKLIKSVYISKDDGPNMRKARNRVWRMKADQIRKRVSNPPTP